MFRGWWAVVGYTRNKGKKGGERVTEDFVPVDANNNPNVEKYVWGVG